LISGRRAAGFEEVSAVAFADLAFVFNDRSDSRRDALRDVTHHLYATASITTPQPYDFSSALADNVSHPDRLCMTSKDNTFSVRPGRVRDRGGQHVRGGRFGLARRQPTSFVAEVQQAIRRAGGNPYRLNGTGKGRGRFNARGRGVSAALALKGRSAWSRDESGVRTRARRVTVKGRVVKLNPQRGAARGRHFVSAKAVDAHLRYLERDGVTRDGARGQVYSARRDVEDGRAFVERGRKDRHQFRFIVSAEDGVELSSLRETSRDLMKQMEADLDTRLDWIAVDHHNTGHPHTHIIVRGVTDDRKVLNIAGDYIAHGVRERARSSPWNWAARPSRKCRAASRGRWTPTASPA
jgi:hypothetical protein